MTVTFAVKSGEVTGYTINHTGTDNRYARLHTYSVARSALATHNAICTHEDCRGYGGDLHVEEDGPDDAVNVSNVNARMLLELLGYTDADLCGSATAADFTGRVLMALAATPVDEGMPAYDDTRPGGARFIECGRREGYAQERLVELEAVAAAAAGAGRQVVWA